MLDTFPECACNVRRVRLQILVHGEQNEMARLKAALIREYEDNDEVHIEVHNPRNTEAVTLNFRGEKLAKVRPPKTCPRTGHPGRASLTFPSCG